MSILSDSEIKILSERKGMIDPFVPNMVRTEEDGRKVLSYGLGSYGYDIRLSDKEFFLFTPGPDGTTDPKAFDVNKVLKAVELLDSEDGSQYFYMPPHSYALGVAKEHLDIPSDVMVIACGKSTYARSGIIANITPAESMWRGHLTLEIANATPTYSKVYANEGIIQLLFFRGSTCATTYQDRKGKYQEQPEQVVFPMM
jgi:dCTP deaminase